MTSDSAPQYVGFWVRTCAALIDTLLITLIIIPITLSIYGWPQLFDGLGELMRVTDLQELMEWLESRETTAEETGVFGGVLDFLISWVLPAIAIIVFWIVRQATPGKMIFSAVIVDATTGAAPSGGQLIGRYLGYFLALFPMGLGILWVGLDRRKQGWHDKLAGTVVVKKRK